MSDTQKQKAVGRPKGTGSILVKLQELVDKFGSEAEVPVRWKWFQTETDKLTKKEAEPKQVEGEVVDSPNRTVNRQVPQATLTP